MLSSSDTPLPCERRIGRNLPLPLPFDMTHRAKVSLKDWHQKSREHFDHRIALPSISFDLKGSTILGQAWVAENHVQLNATALMACELRFHTEVIPHELAHLLAYRMYGADIAPHGEQWRGVMRAFGLEPNATYDVDFEPDATGPYLYACLCGTHGISTRRHNILRRARGSKVLECQKCGEVLRFLEISEEGAILREKEPSARMLAFAVQISERCGVPLPVNARRYASACSGFIEQYKNHRAVAQTRSQNVETGLYQSEEPVVRPTETQLRYAHSIASKKQLVIPDTVSNSRKLLSRWIDRNK